jgi:ABC-2 type transport system permease protein
MRELLLVLNVKANTVIKSLLDFRPQSIFKNLSSFLIFGGVSLGVFFLARASTTYLIAQAHIGQFLFHRFLSMLLYVFFVTVNIGNLIVCYATLYKSDEVTFMMGLPISHEKIFLLKFVDNFFYSSSTLVLLGLSWFLGYGSCYEMPWYFYFTAVFLVFLPFMLIAAILAVLLLMVSMKLASRIGIRSLIAGAVVVYLGSVFVYFRLTNPVKLVQEVMKYYPDVNRYFGYLDAPSSRALPSHWVSEFLYWSVVGDPARALPWFSLLLLVAAGLMILAALLAKRMYYDSWLVASDARAERSSRVRSFRLRFMEFGRGRFFPPHVDAFLRRDFWLFFRDPGQWLHLVLLLVLLLVFIVSLGSLELRSAQPMLQVTSFLVVFLFNGFLLASVLLRFVFPAVSLESESFWCVRSSPVSLNRLYFYKLAVSLFVVLIIAEALAVASTTLLRNDPVLVGVSAVTMGLVGLALTGLNLGAGSYFATFKERNPIRVASSQGASLTFLGSMFYLSFIAVLLLIPLKRLIDHSVIRGQMTVGTIYLPLAVVALFSLLVFGASTVVGLRAMRRDY